jgi:hypothetical protein
MSINKPSEAIGFGRVFTWRAVASASRAFAVLFSLVVAPSILCTNGFAASPLMLDDFKSGPYFKALSVTGASANNVEPLAAGSPLGAARDTGFSLGPNPYKQWNTLSIGRGVFVVDTAVGAVTGITIVYGVTLTGAETPLGLNLSGYSAFQLNIAGIATSESLIVLITVWPHSGGYYGIEVGLPPSGNPIPEVFPFSSFNKGGGGGTLTQSDVSDIDYISIEAQGGGFASFAFTSFEAIE